MRCLLRLIGALLLSVFLITGCGETEGLGGSGGAAGTGRIPGAGGSGGSGGGTAGSGGSGGGTAGSGGAGETNMCELLAPDALRVCVKTLNDVTRACFIDTDQPCASDNPDITAALGVLEDTIRGSCTEDGALRSVDAQVKRLQTACELETASITARTFGGPHGASWPNAGDTLADPCMAEPHRIVSSLVDETLAARNDCLASDVCDADMLAAQERAASDAVAADILAGCEYMPLLIAVEPQEYVKRTMAQLDCLTAIAHADTSPLTLSCGPTVVMRDPPPAPDELTGYAKIVLDSEVYGTRCGGEGLDYPADNPYAFHVKLAPEGHPIENVLIYMEGGGACVFDAEDHGSGNAGCYNTYLEDWSLFETLQTGTPHTAGIMSDSAAISPFSNWTKVYLEYCTQDLHMGGGAISHYESVGFTVHRYGAINARTAMRYLRDLLWKALDERDDEGYRPDRITALFGGFSAGGWGALYNYHWVLDDLQWQHTAAFPDSALALNNTHNGVWNLRFLADQYVLDGPAPYNWAATANQPPYCFGAPCVVGPTLLAAHAPRLEAVPEQQYMILSNQNDEDGQMASTFFDRETTFEQGRVNWINAARQAYCDTKDLDGINYFLMPYAQNLHSTSMDDYYMSQVAVGGEVMGSWLESVFSDPDGVGDCVEEGLLTQFYPGVNPFPCELPPPFDPCEGVDCNDENDCTSDTCNPLYGSCPNTPLPNGAPCDFGGAPGVCQEATCEEDLCVGDPCDDQNACTRDTCIWQDGSCTNPPVFDRAYCDFGGVPGACREGVCEEDLCTENPCNDGNDCTFDNCDPFTGECTNDWVPDGRYCDLDNGGGGGAGGMNGTGVCVAGTCESLPACLSTTDRCVNGIVDEHFPCCEQPVPEQANACDGTESVANPTSCTVLENPVTYRLALMEVEGDCNVGYDIDSCPGQSCFPGGLAPAEGVGGVDNAVAGLARTFEGVGGNLSGVNQALADTICGATDDPDAGTCSGGDNDGEACTADEDCPGYGGSCNLDDDDCMIEGAPADIRFVVDANPDEGCANVTVLADGSASAHILNLSEDGCASGTLGSIPLTIGGIDGAFDNTMVRMTVSGQGFSEGTLGATIDENLAVGIAEAFLAGGSAVVAQVLDINASTPPTQDTSAACNALSVTLQIGGIAQ